MSSMFGLAWDIPYHSKQYMGIVEKHFDLKTSQIWESVKKTSCVGNPLESWHSIWSWHEQGSHSSAIDPDSPVLSPVLMPMCKAAEQTCFQGEKKKLQYSCHLTLWHGFKQRGTRGSNRWREHWHAGTRFHCCIVVTRRVMLSVVYRVLLSVILF